MTNLLTYDGLTHWIWRTNPGVGKFRRFYFFVWLLISSWLQTILYLISHPCVRKDMYNHAHTKTFILHPISKKLLRLERNMTNQPRSTLTSDLNYHQSISVHFSNSFKLNYVLDTSIFHRRYPRSFQWNKILSPQWAPHIEYKRIGRSGLILDIHSIAYT